ncbi:MAG: RsmD family RNA methyltransferase, partial [Verrucomicrobiota bacterium]
TLAVPKGDATRPATDGLRQAVFSSLAAWVPGARFLDLFAGSGAYGLEAMSRGAAGGIFVESNAKAVACIRKNVDAVGKSLGGCAAMAGVRVVQGDALTLAGVDATDAAAVPDLVFVDPPYEMIPQIAPALLARLTELLAGKTDPVVVFELPGELELVAPEGWVLAKRLGKGARQPTVQFLRKA